MQRNNNIKGSCNITALMLGADTDSCPSILVQTMAIERPLNIFFHRLASNAFQSDFLWRRIVVTAMQYM